MARRSLLRKYLIIFLLIILITFLSVYLIQRSFSRQVESPSVVGGGLVENSVERIAVMEIPETLDPLYQESMVEHALCSMLYQTLFEKKGESYEASSLIAEYSFSDQKLTISLNPESRFHGGSRVSASDIKHTLERAIVHGSRSGLALSHMLNRLEGYDDFLEGKTEDLTGILVENSNTLVLTWSGDLALLQEILSLPQLAILEQATLFRSNQYGIYLGENMRPTINGSGYARLIAWSPEGMVFELHSPSNPFTDLRLEVYFEQDIDFLLRELELSNLDGFLSDHLILAEQTRHYSNLELLQEKLSSGRALYLRMSEKKEEPLVACLALALNRSKLLPATGWENTLSTMIHPKLRTEEDLLFYENQEIARNTWSVNEVQWRQVSLGMVEKEMVNKVTLKLKDHFSALGIPVILVEYNTMFDLVYALQEGEIDGYVGQYFSSSVLPSGGLYVMGVSADVTAQGDEAIGPLSGIRTSRLWMPLMQNEQYWVTTSDADPGFFWEILNMM